MAHQVQYPVFVRERDSRVPDVMCFASADELEDTLEAIDVENDEYLAWDTRGVRLHLVTQSEDGHWLGLKTSRVVQDEYGHWLTIVVTDAEDMDGLVRAVDAYVEAVGLQTSEIRGFPLEDRVRRISDAARLQWNKRRWYQLWRRG